MLTDLFPGAIILTLNNLLEKIPLSLKPFLPQLQRTFAKSLADTSSETLRIRAAKALGTLITLTPRVDPLIAGKETHYNLSCRHSYISRTCDGLEDPRPWCQKCDVQGTA